MVEVDLVAEAIDQLGKARKWQNRVAAFEDAALVQAYKDGAKEEDADFAASMLLKNNFQYSTAIGNRNSHQRQAEVVAAVATAAATAKLVDLVTRNPDL